MCEFVVQKTPLMVLMLALVCSVCVIAAEEESANFPSCDPENVDLASYSQWKAETGYWIGEYTFMGADGNAYQSANWPYRYDHYRGFITGNVSGNSYRQRNVFLYPPKILEQCTSKNETVGFGECGVNGNMKTFKADQSATKCSTNPLLGGSIEGPYGPLSYTYTSLIGQDNAVLYQVYLTADALNSYELFVLGNPYQRCNATTIYCGYDKDRIIQSQLTTLTSNEKQEFRTRTAQGFDAFANIGSQTYASFYRERKVTEEEFWRTFNATIVEYNILDSDLCAWSSGDFGGTVPSEYSPRLEACAEHLSQSFELENFQEELLQIHSIENDDQP